MHEKTRPPFSSRFPGGAQLDAIEVDARDISYCNHVSYHLYRFYLAGLAGADLYLGYLRRGVAKWLQLQYPTLTHEQRTDAVQRGIVSLWTVASRGMVPTRHPAVYANYVIKVCRTSVANTLHDRNLRPVTQYLDKKGWRGTTTTQPARPETVAFLHELPDVLRRRVVETSRFSYDPVVFHHVVDSLWNDEEPDAGYLRRAGVESPVYFVEHVTLRLRALLYEMRSTIEVFGRGDDLRMLAVFDTGDDE